MPVATTSGNIITESPARCSIVPIFANAAVVAPKPRIAFTLAVCITDAVPAAGRSRAAVRVTDPCRIVIDSALATMFLSLSVNLILGTTRYPQLQFADMLTCKIPASAYTLSVVVTFTTSIASF